MSEEAQRLKDQVARLMAENERLKSTSTAQATNVGASSSSASSMPVDRLVFIPREKKCPLFRGGVGISVEAWKEEAEACMRARHLSTLERAYFLFDHLEGEAREEIRYRPIEEKENPEKIFEILQELYGCPRSYVALQESFFSRKQQEGESLLEFSISLLTLMDKVKRSAPEGILNAEVLLRDQFVEHVSEGALRRHLKSFIRMKPLATLIEVRKEAIRWEREGSTEPQRPRSFSLPSSDRVFGVSGTSCSMASGAQGDPSLRSDMEQMKADIARLVELVQQQQGQLQHLSQAMTAGGGLHRRGQSPRGGPIICRRCHQQGHYAGDCQGEFVAGPPPIAPPRGSGPPLGQAPRSNQPSGN